MTAAGPAPDLDSVRILGSRVHLVTLPRAVSILEGWIQEQPAPCRQVVVTGFHGLWEAHKDHRLKAVLNAADLWVPDGIAPVWVARCRGKRGVHRVPGADLLNAFLARGQRAGYRSFFYGDTEPTLTALKRAVEERYPGHVVAGTLAPPFGALKPEEDADHIRAINAAKPDVLWVGLGTPKQDRWIHEHLDRLQVPVAVGVGAAFRFVAGTVKRAPAWVGNAGLEWAYRIAREPAKLWRRSLIEGPQFVFHVLMELAGWRRYD